MKLLDVVGLNGVGHIKGFFTTCICELSIREHIFALIQQQLKLRQPVKRLWISDLTAESIATGFERLRDASEFEFLTQAARARSEADWLIGMNASRAFTTRHNTLLSVGRVQTPVLALIHDREKEIEAFQSQTFYDVWAEFKQDQIKYKGAWQGDRLTKPEEAEEIAAAVRGKIGKITKYDTKQTKEYPFKLYDLTLLQREANAKYGYSAKKTLDVAQALYERHKVISYPRTNSNYVTEQNIDGMHKALRMLGTGPYADLVQQANPNLVHKQNKSVCNPSRVEDHHAILPTLKRPGTLSKEEQNVYDLVIRRFLSHFFPPAEYKMHTVMTQVDKHLFKTNIKELLSLGWKVVLSKVDQDKGKKSKSPKKEDEEETDEWTDKKFEIDAGRPVDCVRAEMKEKATQPPKSYTEGTLLKAMESAGKQMENEELREVMKDAGLGTPATRAATIERLKKVGYIEMKGKKILITEKGKMAIDLIRHAGVDLLASPEMTGQWERRLHQISKGEAAQEKFMENVKRFTLSIIDKVRQQPPAPANAFGEEARGKRAVGKEGASSARASGRTAAKGVGRATSGRGGSAGSATLEQAAPPARSSSDGSSGISGSQRQALGSCPRSNCGGSIIEGRKGYGCSHYKQGCGFVVWKEYAGKQITETMLKSLLTRGQTQLLSFKRKDGSTVKARIVLNEPGTGQLSVREES
ncbi:DNA topoisomerase [Paenibacillus sp. FSL P4-0113]|uniref:type IA DNA topoisomerase n=1 Tax=Paenibacillus sp. FSL P4-0113 TaxID=2921630 RepID=UPI0030FC8182